MKDLSLLPGIQSEALVPQDTGSHQREMAAVLSSWPSVATRRKLSSLI
jgi:hypothetical protein